MNNINMIFYNWNVASEEIDVNKSNESKECDICHFLIWWYCYFIHKRHGLLLYY